jgi:hypothetical protein
MTFAVNGHPGFLDLQLAGVILMATGLAAMWLRIGSARLARAGSRVVSAGTRMARDGAQALDRMSLPGPQTGQRVPLRDLLGYAGGPASEQVSRADPAAGHEAVREATFEGDREGIRS